MKKLGTLAIVLLLSQPAWAATFIAKIHLEPAMNPVTGETAAIEDDDVAMTETTPAILYFDNATIEITLVEHTDNNINVQVKAFETVNDVKTLVADPAVTTKMNKVIEFAPASSSGGNWFRLQVTPLSKK